MQEEQEKFKQEFPNLVNAALKTKEPQDNRPILLMAQDEGRFGLWSQVMKAWCLLDHRPLVAKQGVRDYVYAGRSDRSCPGQNDNFGTSFCEYRFGWNCFSNRFLLILTIILS